MTVLQASPEGVFPPAIADAVKTAVEKMFFAISGEMPIEHANGEQADSCPCVAGIISFFGDMPWSLSWVLNEETAPALAQKFAGFEIPFDSPDMGDVTGELV